jgi:hypothetical protein
LTIFGLAKSLASFCGSVSLVNLGEGIYPLYCFLSSNDEYSLYSWFCHRRGGLSVIKEGSLRKIY